MTLLDATNYQGLRERVRVGDGELAPCVTELRERARSMLAMPVPAVTDKQFTPHSPSQDRHDYVSVGTYWWPNPQTPDGLPYVNRDGQLSPDLELYDRNRWARAADGIVTLAKAAYFLDDSASAQAAVAWTRRWFLDPATRMNPHLKYGQMVPGRCTGRQYGIVDFALYLPTVLDHVRLLATLDNSPWTAADEKGLASWCSDFLAWLETHEFGRAEEAAPNNHAVCYDRLVVCLALFLDRPDRARAQLAKTQARIAQQIQPDGSMPHELRRTCSFGYSMMNTRAFVELATIGHRLGVDLWPQGEATGIGAAVDFLYRHACSPAPWPYQQIEPVDWRMLCPVFRLAGTLAGKDYPLSAIHRLPEGFVPAAFPLVEPIHPFGQLRSPTGT